MTGDERKARIKQGFEALGAGDGEPLMSIFDDGVKWTIIGDTKFSGTYDGMADVGERLLGPLGELLDGHLHITPSNFIAEGDYVVVQGTGESKTRAGGTYNNTYCWVYRWSGDKVVEVTEYLDTEVLTASFGR
ncbi:MAG: nuclear transport factor 2 family protein [Gammaproteobacteria bacterium]